MDFHAQFLIKKNYDESKIYDVVKCKKSQGVEMENKHIQQTDFISAQTQTERIVTALSQIFYEKEKCERKKRKNLFLQAFIYFLLFLFSF